MSQVIEIPGQGEVEFPDEMSDADISAAIRKITGPPMAASHTAPVAPPKSEIAARGGLQGLSMGWGDEGAGAIAATLPFTDPEAAKGETWGERYRNARDFYRAKNRQAEAAGPVLYNTAQVGGAVLPAVLSAGTSTAAAPAAAKGGAALLKTVLPQAARAAGQGALQGAGYAEGDSKNLAGDTALGAALGLGGYGAGKVLGKTLSYVARKGAEKAGLATARAGAKASELAAEPVVSARGAYGNAVQQGSRYIENLMRLEESMTPEQKALYEGLKSSGVVPDLQKQIAQSTLERLPAQAETIAAKKAALEALQKAAEQDAAAKTAALLSPAEMKSQLAARAWRYGPPAVGSLIGSAVGGPMGTAIGALAGAGTRPMVQSLRRMANTPAVQKAIGETMQKGAEGTPLRALVRALQLGAPAALTPLVAPKE